MPLDFTQPYGIITGDTFGRAFQQNGVVYKRDGTVWSAPSTYLENIAAMKVNSSGAVVGLVRPDGTEATLDGGEGGAVSSVNMKTGNVQLTAADIGALPAPYKVGAVHFDGTSYLLNPALACNDSGSFSFSFWVLVATLQNSRAIWQVDGADTYVSGANFGPDGNSFDAAFFSAGKAESLSAISEHGSITVLTWHHVMGGIATDQASGQKVRKIYIDGVESAEPIGAEAENPFLIQMSGLPFSFGDDTYGYGAVMDVAEVWIAPGQSLLTSTAITLATRRKFITDDGKPVYLGENGELPTGVSPSIFFHAEPGNEVATFTENRGTGGGFSLVGSLSAAANAPSDALDLGFGNPMMGAGDLIIGGASGAATRLANPGAGTFALQSVGGVLTWVAV